MAHIRKATPDDVPHILAMAKDMHAESPRYSKLVFVEEKVFNLTQALLANPQLGGILVAQHGTRVVGMFAFEVGEHYFSSDKFASDVVMYIKPDYRSGMLFPRLISAFEKWADEFGVKEKLLGVSAQIDSERTVAVLERLGYAACVTGLMKKE